MTGANRPRKWLLGGLAILTVAAALVAARLVPAWRPAPVGATFPLLRPAPLTIAPGVHLLGGLDPAAAYVVETGDGLVLIDAGLKPDAEPVKRDMAILGLDWRRVRAVLLTHVHADHSGGAGHFRTAAGARVYAGRSDAALLRAGEPREAFFSTFYLPDAVASPTPVDVELAGGEVLAFGDVRFEALAAPGHTPGSICYLMERAGLRVLFSGDVVMSLAGDPRSRNRRARPLGTYVAYEAPRYRGDAAAFLSSLRRLRAVPAPDLVLPGHPRMDPTPQSPGMTQARWEALLDDGIRNLEALVARYERDGLNFLDGVPKKLLPGLYYLGDRGGRAVYGFFASSRFYIVDAPGGPGLSDFLDGRLKGLGLKPQPPAAVLLTACCPEEAAGLRELVEKCHTTVVAPPAGVDRIKDSCPPGTAILSADDLPAKGWFSVETVPLRGRGQAAVAYQLRWTGKAVLLCGRIPIKPDQESVQGLYADFAKGEGDSIGYRAALDALDRLKPDLWLPASPAQGQNATLYDYEWEDIIAANRKLQW